MKTKNGDFHEKSMRMMEDEECKFLGRLLSKESTTATAPSFRIYYGGDVPSGVPFLWETRPGTPKHPSAVDYDVRPLTPPPGSSFHGSQLPNYATTNKSGCKLFLQTLIRKANSQRKEKTGAVISSSPSSLSTISWSSSSHSLFYDPKKKRRRRFHFPHWGSFAEEEDCVQENGNNGNRRRSGVLLVQFKRALSSIVNRRSANSASVPPNIASSVNSAGQI